MGIFFCFRKCDLMKENGKHFNQKISDKIRISLIFFAEMRHNIKFAEIELLIPISN